MKLSIFGLGYVGAVSSACFAKLNHCVIGVDVNRHKVDLINSGQSPIIENGLEELIQAGVESQKIRASIDPVEAVKASTLSIICVGTPSQRNGNIDLSYIYQVTKQIAEVLRTKDRYHTILIRSTVKPGTIAECIKIVEQISGKQHGIDFGMGSNPEFLREGTALADFWNPPYTIIGTDVEEVRQQTKELYESISGELYFIRPEEAEMIKYANNNFHALKITFANEIGNICKELQVDSHVVMDLVAKDTKLNLSPYYLKPGFAFGGSCLPKDVRGLNYCAKNLDVKVPLLNSLMISNEEQVKRAYEMVHKTGKRRIGVLGFAFKDNTDDLRESPVLSLIETLIGKGFDLSLYDSNVLLSKLLGKNKEFLFHKIPHITKLLKENVEEVVAQSEVLLIGNKSSSFNPVLKSVSPAKIIIDLVRLDAKKTTNKNYVGICW